MEIESSKASSTSIRGYNLYSRGYQLDRKFSPYNIVFNKIDENIFDKIREKLKNSGFEIESFSAPSKTIGGGSRSNISIKPFYSEYDFNK